jgi:hypothetical protein
MLLSCHGVLSSCVGPVVDVQFYSKSSTVSARISLSLSSCFAAQDAPGLKAIGAMGSSPYPCVFDSIVICRPRSIFREGVVVNNFGGDSGSSRFSLNQFMFNLQSNSCLTNAILNALSLDFSSAPAGSKCVCSYLSNDESY